MRCIALSGVVLLYLRIASYCLDSLRFFDCSFPMIPLAAKNLCSLLQYHTYYTSHNSCLLWYDFPPSLALKGILGRWLNSDQKSLRRAYALRDVATRFFSLFFLGSWTGPSDRPQ